MEPPCVGRRKAYIIGPGHMTKMASMPLYVEITSPKSKSELGMQDLGLKLNKVYINGDPRLTLTLLAHLSRRLTI